MVTVLACITILIIVCVIIVKKGAVLGHYTAPELTRVYGLSLGLLSGFLIGAILATIIGQPVKDTVTSVHINEIRFIQRDGANQPDVLCSYTKSGNRKDILIKWGQVTICPISSGTPRVDHVRREVVHNGLRYWLGICPDKPLLDKYYIFAPEQWALNGGSN